MRFVPSSSDCVRIVSALLLLSFLGRPLAAQGTQADYDRAAGLQARFSNKVLNEKLIPHWADDGKSFWYRKELAGGGHEFMAVETESGSQRRAFDHKVIAEALSNVLNKNVDVEHLPVHDFLVDETTGSVTLLCNQGVWTFNISGDVVPTTTQLLDQFNSTAQILPVTKPSLQQSSPTAMLFVNRLPEPVELFWIDFEGDRRSYTVLKPGDSHLQSTYKGHVWLVANQDREPVVVFRATHRPSSAVIDTERRSSDLPTQPQRTSRRDRISPDGAWRAFFRDHNLYVRRLESDENFESGKEIALSADGTEADRYTGRVWWSPDSRYVVAMRKTRGGDRKVHYVESSPKDQLQPRLHAYDYLKPGDKIPQARPQLFAVDTLRHVAVDPSLAPTPWSNDHVHWAADSSCFYFLYNQRGHQLARVLKVDAETGETRVVVDEHPETFFCYSSKAYLHYLPKTDELIWMSERSGWNHLYLYDAKLGEVKNPITEGEWVVRGVERVDEEARELTLRVSGVSPGQDPYYVHYARVNFDGSQFTLLTDADGAHTVQYSPDRKYLIDSWSRIDQPPVHALRRTEDGALVSEVLRADATALRDAGWVAPEAFVAKGRDGETDIYGVIVRPTNFDPAKKYPILEHIYAGPHSAFVPKAFRSFLGMQKLAELGFIVVQIDGMGTSHRSKAFHDVAWKNLGDSGFPDRIAWMKAAARRYPQLDLSRVGIYGGSAGGQSSTRGLLMYPEFYHVAVSDCGCHDNRVDKIWWNEQWMGWPIGPHYESQSNVTQAHRLQGKLLLIVGEMDENVDPASTMQVVDALIKADKDFDLLVIPGAGHGAAGTPYGARRQADYFVRHLLGVEPRQ